MPVPEQQLRKAIREHRVVRFRYERGPGPAGTRICHPHVLFESETGDVLVDTVQVGGPSRSGARTRWRTFDPRLMSDLDILPNRFDPDPGLNLDAARYHRVFAHC